MPRKRDRAQPPRKILAIRFARLGDVVLLLPALALLKRRLPDSELTFLTGHRCAPLAELCPAIDAVIAVDRIAMRDGPVWRAVADMSALVRDIRRRRFDMVVDFHSFRETNLLTWLSGAPLRIGMKRDQASYLRFCFNLSPVVEDKTLHVADMFRKVVEGIPIPTAQKPPVADSHSGYESRCLGRLTATKVERPTVVLFVDAPVPERIWPPERFAEVADYVLDQWGADVIVIASKDRPELANRVREASRNRDRLSVFTDLTLLQLARVIASSHLLISNDTGPMHIGPATGVPTLGLFSVGYPEHFRPYGTGNRFLRGNPIDKIEVAKVIESAREMWATVDRDLRR